MKQITSKNIADWMQTHANKVLETRPHVQIRTCHVQNVGYSGTMTFSIYAGAGVSTGDHPTIEGCFAELGTITPKTIAIKKREAAAKLIAEAIELENKATI